ncbi:hypothetical protein Hanom_Chr12g01156951 [Helianthus anomalus]
MKMRYCLLSTFGLEGICEIDRHFDSLANYQLSFFTVYFVYLSISFCIFELCTIHALGTMQILSVGMRHLSRSVS